MTGASAELKYSRPQIAVDPPGGDRSCRRDPARRREFDGVVDGIVYAGLAGVGFAFTENVLYLGRALQDNGTAGLAVTFVLRGVFGPFAHPMFTMATGIGLGVAATTRRRWLRVVAPLVGWLCAVALHAMWNLSAVAGGNVNLF